ncbi:MAG: nuclear transport factor 2 family protein [Pseudomonadota bacterium]
MDAAVQTDDEAVRAQTVAYVEGIHFSRPEAFEEMCHPNFLMTAVAGSGAPVFWNKAAYLERVAGRAPFPGAPSYDILDIDVGGDQIARVKLWVDVPPRRYEDHLGFLKVDGRWQLITKVFRTLKGPALEG